MPTEALCTTDGGHGLSQPHGNWPLWTWRDREGPWAASRVRESSRPLEGQAHGPAFPK